MSSRPVFAVTISQRLRWLALSLCGRDEAERGFQSPHNPSKRGQRQSRHLITAIHPNPQKLPALVTRVDLCTAAIA